ncbi:MAG TPA: cytochrome C peroxidase, partial [Polyangiaceae bacterium]|nr:cytochrome C peroxidase [Polyangiaceae bacterium]
GMKSAHDQADLEALVAFVSSLPPPPRVASADRARVARGQTVFGAYGCERCHAGGASDGKAHDIGSGSKDERRQAFDTPTLTRVGRTAPYFHDGRYATLDDLLRSSDTEMVDGSKLADGDRLALEAYLETL